MYTTGIKIIVSVEGQFTDFFSYTFLEITKKSHTKSQNRKKNHIQNRKITRKITNRKHQKSQITEKLLKNHTKTSLESQKITEKKSCDFKITKITYATLRSDLPLGKCQHFTIFEIPPFSLKVAKYCFTKFVTWKK